MTLICTPHFHMVNWLRVYDMLLILFFKVEIEHTFYFQKQCCILGKTSKDNVAFNNVAFSIYFEYIKNFFKMLHKTAILCLAIHSSDRK